MSPPQDQREVSAGRWLVGVPPELAREQRRLGATGALDPVRAQRQFAFRFEESCSNEGRGWGEHQRFGLGYSLLRTNNRVAQQSGFEYSPENNRLQ